MRRWLVQQGVEINGLEIIDTEVQSLTDNMNRATAGLKLGSSESGQEEGGQGNNSDDSNDPSYHTEDDSYDTPNKHDINPEY